MCNQTEMVPSCQPDWITCAPFFSEEILCQVADRIGSLSAYANVDQYFTLRSFAEIIGMISVNLIMWYCN